MNIARKNLASLAIVVAFALFALCARPAFASTSDAADVKATIAKWIADLNKGDMRSIVAACASHTAIVDGFPPFAWQTCADWMNDYEANNKTIQGTPGILEIGQSIHEELHGKDAYFIYPSTFSDTQNGKPIVYKGTMTMTLRKTRHGWVFTGAASAWGVNTLDLSKGVGP